MSDTNGQPPTPSPHLVQPHPTPITMNLAEGMAPDGQKVLAVSFASCTGTSIYFWTKEEAKMIGDMIAKAAQRMTGLVVP